MIATLTGQITERNPLLDKGTAELVIEVAGVGYGVTISLGASENLSSGAETKLFIHHHITEADQRLYGFLSSEEKTAFKGLLAAHGVGPSLAMAVLATHSVPQLAAILDSDDVDALCETPGVGKKTAQRLLVELKSSLVLPVIDSDSSGTIDLTKAASGAGMADVKQALESLGYSKAEIREAVSSIDRSKFEEDQDTGALLKLALKELGS